ncbi:MAG: hypothetical protein KIG16_01800 [Eubacteriales bacterium]|nr:hypothetical protein [Eubacteriales bacterium]
MVVARQAKTMVEKGMVSLSLFKGIKPNDYELKPGEIVTICGPKGHGKTTLTAHIATSEMLPNKAWYKVREARAEAKNLRLCGFRYAFVPENVKHLVFSEIPIRTCSDQGYLPRWAHKLDFDRMLLPNGKNNAQFFPYGAILVIDELMNKFAARDYTSGKMPKEMCDFLRLIRHRGISVVTNSLVPTGADKGVRDMSQTYMLIVHRADDWYRGKPRTTWYCLEFDNDKSCAKFAENPYRKGINYVPYVFEHVGDIHKCVDSNGENDKFLVGMRKRPIEFKSWRRAA